MLKHPWRNGLWLALLVAAFSWGVLQLLQSRFQVGDVYPAYSSLRGDALGTRVLFDALDELPGTRVERHLRADQPFPEGGRVTSLVLGLTLDDLNLAPGEFSRWERFLKQGGRLVIALLPVRSHGPTNSAARAPTGGSRRIRPHSAGLVHFPHAWGIEEITLEGDSKVASFEAVRQAGFDTAGPALLSWHSDGILRGLSEEWRVVYARGTNAVLAERKVGRGTLVFSSDAYSLSNEGLRQARQPALLSWIIGPAEQIVFNETHLGVVEKPGVAALARKYRLHGLLGALLGLAGLFIWRNASPFSPRALESARRETIVEGRDSQAGFENLLPRAVPEKTVVQVAFAEWHRNATLDRPVVPGRIAAADELLRNAHVSTSPAELYNQVANTLRPRSAPDTPISP